MQHWAYYNKEAKIFILLPSSQLPSASLIFAQFMRRSGPVKRKSESFRGLIFCHNERELPIQLNTKYSNNSISSGQFKIFK
jgi:hypothetical protein